LVKKLDVVRNNLEEAPSFGVDMAFLKKFNMNDLTSCLENDFGLWLGHGPMPTLPERADDKNDNAMEFSKEKKEDSTSVIVDVYALKNIFLIWMALFDRNLILLREISEEEQNDNSNSDRVLFGQDASKALAAVIRVGLDPHFNSAADTCGEPLLSLIQKLTASLVHSTTRQLSERSNDGASTSTHLVERWMTHTANVIVEACSDLSSGDENAADSDDGNGDLALAMAVKRMSPYCELDTNAHSMDNTALMKAKFAQGALCKCLKEIAGWENRVKERMDYLCKDWKNKKDAGNASSVVVAANNNERLQHAMHALVTAEVGFTWIDEESDSFMNNHSRFLAAVLIAGECALVGAGIYFRALNNDNSPSEEDNDTEPVPVYTTEEKDAVYEVISNIEDLTDGLKKECRAVIAFPHLRRAKEYLTRLTKELGATKGKSSKDKRKKRREQGSLDSYFSRPSMSQSDPFVDSHDS